MENTEKNDISAEQVAGWLADLVWSSYLMEKTFKNKKMLAKNKQKQVIRKSKY